MKKSSKVIMCLLAAVVVIAAAFGTVVAFRVFRGRTASAPGNLSADSKTVDFGTYPQSRVTDKALLDQLNALDKTMLPFGSTATDSDGQTDYMRYADVTLDGKKYRAVEMDLYRPYRADEAATEAGENSNIPDNGYETGTTYWFRFEPLTWRVIDADSGLLWADAVLDAQPFRDTVYEQESEYYTDETYTSFANCYAVSSLRRWLNEDFWNTAFTPEEQASILPQTLENPGYGTIREALGDLLHEYHGDTIPAELYKRYDYPAETDRVFLLSVPDMVDPAYGCGIGDCCPAMAACSTDYAIIQGLPTTENRSGRWTSWWLRTAGTLSDYACGVDLASDGWSYWSGNAVWSKSTDPTGMSVFCCSGVRPAIVLKELRRTAPEEEQEETGTTARPTETTMQTPEIEDWETEVWERPVTFAATATTDATTTTTTTTSTGWRTSTTRRTTNTWRRYTTTRQTTTTTTPKTTYTVSLSGDKGVIALEGGGAYQPGDKVTVTATTLIGYNFLRWASSDPSVLGDGSKKTYTFTMPESNVTLRAKTEAPSSGTTTSAKSESTKKADEGTSKTGSSTKAESTTKASVDSTKPGSASSTSIDFTAVYLLPGMTTEIRIG